MDLLMPCTERLDGCVMILWNIGIIVDRLEYPAISEHLLASNLGQRNQEMEVIVTARAHHLDNGVRHSLYNLDHIIVSLSLLAFILQVEIMHFSNAKLSIGNIINHTCLCSPVVCVDNQWLVMLSHDKLFGQFIILLPVKNMQLVLGHQHLEAFLDYALVFLISDNTPIFNIFRIFHEKVALQCTLNLY